MTTSSRYLDIIAAIFVAVLITSNIASTKIVSFGGATFDAGLILFPLAYIFGDILTEVYGFARARRVIWMGFAMLLLTSVTLALVDVLPAATDYPYAADFSNILGQAPRIVAASLLAYLAGGFINSTILAVLKVRTQGRHFWLRALSSTVFGQAVDTTLFTLVAFYGVMPSEVLLAIIITNYVVKLAVEVLLLPVTYRVVALLKRAEGLDVYDTTLAGRFRSFFRAA